MSNFNLGKIEITEKAAAALSIAGVDIENILLKHQRGEWGDCDSRQRNINDFARLNGLEITSSYNIMNDITALVITDPNRFNTRVLLTQEYECIELDTLQGYALIRILGN